MKTLQRQFLLILLLSITLFGYGQNSTETLETYSPKGSLSLRTNLVSWLLLTPNLGLEYKTSDRIGLIAEGGWAHWSLSSQNKYWRMWNIAPQARYYVGKEFNSYIGAQYTMGSYNIEGNQGSYKGGGLTLGHQFYAGKNLMVDLGISLGYLHMYDKEKYQHIDGHDYRTSSKSSNGYWGPTGVSMTFVWKIN